MLALPHARIGEAGMETIAEMIQLNGTIVHLDLSYNGAVGQSAKLVAEAGACRK